jgi:hypothetical protein
MATQEPQLEVAPQIRARKPPSPPIRATVALLLSFWCHYGAVWGPYYGC